MTDMLVNLRLKADGSGFVGEVKLSREEVKKLSEEAGKLADAFDQVQESTKDQIRDLEIQAKAQGMSTKAAAAYRKEQELLQAAAKSGRTITSELTRDIKTQAAAFGDASKQMDDAERSTRRLAAAKQVAAAAAAALTAAIIAGSLSAARAIAEDEAAQRKLEAVMRATGNTTGLTIKQLNAFVTEMKNTTRATEEDLWGAVTALATFPTISGKIFKETISAAQDMTAIYGGGLKESLDGLARAIEDPIEGFDRLRDKGFTLSAEQERLAKQFMETGQYAKAQEIVLKSLTDAVGGAGEAESGGLTGAHTKLFEAAQNSFKAILEGSGAMDFAIRQSELWTRVLNALTGAITKTGGAARLAEINLEIGGLEKSNSGTGGLSGGADARRLAALRQERQELEARLAIEERVEQFKEQQAEKSAEDAKTRRFQQEQEERARTKAEEAAQKAEAERQRQAQQDETSRERRQDLLADLRAELDMQTRLQGVELERAAFIRQRVKQLGAGATPGEIAETTDLAGKLFDGRQAAQRERERQEVLNTLAQMKSGWMSVNEQAALHAEELRKLAETARGLGLDQEAAEIDEQLLNGGQRVIEQLKERSAETIRLANLSEEERDAELEVQDIVSDAAQQGIELSEKQRAILVEILRLRNQTIAAIDKQKEAEKKAAQETAKIALDLRNRIEDAFTNLFAGIFDGGLKSLKDFGKSIVNALKHAFAEGLSRKLIKPMLDDLFGDEGSGKEGVFGKMLKSIPGGIGKAIGAAIMVGGLVASLLGSTPRTAGTVAVNGAGDLFAGDYGAKGGADIKDARSVTGNAISQLRDIAKQLDVDLKSGFTLGQLGMRGDKYVFQEQVTSIKEFGKKKYGGQRFESAEEAVSAAIENAIRRGILTGLSAVEEATLKSAENIQEALEHIMDARAVRDKIAQFTNPLKFALDQLAKQQADERELAVEFGYDMVQLEKMQAQERLDIIEQFGEEAVSSLREAIQRLKTGDLSPLTPVDMLSEAQKAYAAAKASGDNEALAQAGVGLVDAARAVYAGSEQFFAVYNEVLATLAAAEKSAQAEIDRQVAAAARDAAAAASVPPANAVTTPAGGVSLDSAAIIAALRELGMEQANTNASLQELAAMAADGSITRGGYKAAS